MLTSSPAERVRRYIVQELVRDEDVQLAEGDPLFSVGLLDSFAVSELICFLEDEFAVRIPIAQVRLDDFDTIEQCLAVARRFGGRSAQ